MKCIHCSNDLIDYEGSRGKSLHCVSCQMVYNREHMEINQMMKDDAKRKQFIKLCRRKVVEMANDIQKIVDCISENENLLTPIEIDFAKGLMTSLFVYQTRLGTEIQKETMEDL